MSTEETALASPVQENLRLVALDPKQLQQSQQQLIGWCDGKIAEVSAEVDDLQSNLDISKKAKWNTARAKNSLRIAKGRLIFYTKIKEALGAGFYIVPNFPCDIFAIRTTAAKPSEYGTANYEHFNLPLETGQLKEVGVGQYQNPETYVSTTKLKRQDSNGKEIISYKKEATSYQEMDFPFVLAKPQVLSATQRAMALKIFDELGVCPQTKKSDPLVLGIIKAPKFGWSQKQVTFMVAWWLDTNTL